MLQSKISTPYEKHSGSRICQGDIYREFSFNIVIEEEKVLEIMFPYIVVISQDCDLDSGYKENGLGFQATVAQFNQFLPNVLFLPAFHAESIREGKHLETVFKITQERMNADRWKLITQNNNERYHCLSSYPDYQVPELIIDFKAYFTLPTNAIFPKIESFYLATINELFRERLSQRFAYYLSRIGLPEKTSIKTKQSSQLNIGMRFI